MIGIGKHDMLKPVPKSGYACVIQGIFMSGKRRIEVASELQDERLADVLQELPDDDQVQILFLPSEGVQNFV